MGLVGVNNHLASVGSGASIEVTVTLTPNKNWPAEGLIVICVEGIFGQQKPEVIQQHLVAIHV